MKRAILAALALSLTSLSWLASAAPAPTRDELPVPLPQEQFAMIETSVRIKLDEQDSWIFCDFYNGSNYRVDSLDIEISLEDFPWNGEEHASRTWLYRCGTRGDLSGLPFDVSSVAHRLGVNPKNATAKVVGAHGILY